MVRRVWAVTLTVKDLRKAVRFYEKALGLIKKYQFKDYAGFDCGGVEIGLKTWGKLENPREGEPCLDLQVDDIDRTYRALKAKGVDFLKKPASALWGARFAVFRDPDGNVLQLTQVDWTKYFKVSAKAMRAA
jgi:catechol 2,3-dioxygenase-like lactoylglutathione lyase family enzyme